MLRSQYRAGAALIGAALLLPWATAQQHDNHVQGIGTIAGSGSYPAIAEAIESMPENTLYRPAQMPQQKLPLVLWGNGGCRDNGLRYANFLKEVASHGYLIVAAGYPRQEGFPPTSETETPGNPAESAPEGRADATDAEQLIRAIDWASKATGDEHNRFFGRIDTNNVAVMGHSCGGLQAMQVATDPRIDAVVLFNSGVLNKPLSGPTRALNLPKSILKKLHSPIAYVIGGKDDVAYANALDDFERITHIPVLFANNDVGHSGTFRQPDGGSYADVAVHWLNWRLRADKASSDWFRGSECHLCKDQRWQIRQEKLDVQPD